MHPNIMNINKHHKRNKYVKIAHDQKSIYDIRWENIVCQQNYAVLEMTYNTTYIYLQ